MKSSDVWISEEGIVFTGNLGGVKLLDDPVDVLREVLEENRRLREVVESMRKDASNSGSLVASYWVVDMCNDALADIDAGSGADE
ncbi:hypothetical protein [Alicyclobacillus fastidiosus]|uniref:Uncharacterized protein n=1 Tax=Alicyclobacillus fastidiosus TaxID=392011 RepID=A0ABV5ALJ9_9BACL|nr:hypothetical protein [Alicyclobacillus fastidiosus]WEH09288.1 hypothetical protein PYS47_21870 [Alicyclobacillus fastidiosus]